MKNAEGDLRTVRTQEVSALTWGYVWEALSLTAVSNDILVLPYIFHELLQVILAFALIRDWNKLSNILMGDSVSSPQF